MRNKKLFLYLACGACLTLTVVAFGLITVLRNPVIRAQHYKQSNRPEIVVDAFFHALVEGDLDLAKELAIPGLQERIDNLKTESRYQAFRCPWGNLIEPYAGGLGPNITYSSSNKAMSDGVAYSCYYGNRSSMNISGIALEHNGREWLIADWEEICESSSSSPETCY